MYMQAGEFKLLTVSLSICASQSTVPPPTFSMPVTVPVSSQSPSPFSNPGSLVTTSFVTSTLTDPRLLSPQQSQLQRNTVSPGLPQRPASAGKILSRSMVLGTSKPSRKEEIVTHVVYMSLYCCPVGVRLPGAAVSETYHWFMHKNYCPAFIFSVMEWWHSVQIFLLWLFLADFSNLISANIGFIFFVLI